MAATSPVSGTRARYEIRNERTCPKPVDGPGAEQTAGLEPATFPMATGCSTTELRLHVERATGLEPVTSDLEGRRSTI